LLPPTQGRFVCEWIEEFCLLGAGDYFGQKYALRPWQKAFIYQLYEQTAAGRRRYRSALLGLPRGNGKTALIAAIGVFELCSDYRDSPLVSVCAASFEQASLVFDDMKDICRASPMLEANTHIWDTEILLRNKPGRAYRVAAVAGTNEGQRPTCAIFDEVHELTGNKERAHLVLTNGVAKRRDAFALNISTAGSDPESLLGQMYDKGQKINRGDLDDPGFLFVWYQGNPAIDPKTREEWTAEIESCNPAAGDFLDTQAVVSRCMELPAFEADRYHRNLFTAADTLWEPGVLWDGLKSDLELDPALPLFVGIDGGLKHDSSAVVWCQKLGDRIVLRSKVWANPYAYGTRQHQKWKFQISDLEDLCRELCAQFPKSAVRDDKGRALAGPAFFYDPFMLERSAQMLESEGATLIESPQNDSRMVPASQALFDLVKQGVIAHDGDPELRRQIRSVVAEQKPRGWRISKAKSRHKIDAAVATAMAVHAASQTGAEPPTPGIRIIGDN